MLAFVSSGESTVKSNLARIVMPVKSIYQSTTIAPTSTQLPKSVAQNPTLGGGILQANSPAKTTTGLGGLLGSLPAPVTTGLGDISAHTGLSLKWAAVLVVAVIIGIVALVRG
jgi:hypothetical protein